MIVGKETNQIDQKMSSAVNCTDISLPSLECNHNGSDDTGKLGKSLTKAARGIRIPGKEVSMVEVSSHTVSEDAEDILEVDRIVRETAQVKKPSVTLK